MYRYFFKRIIDFVFSLLSLFFLSPLLVVVTIWLFVVNKGSGVFFTPIRPGKNGKLFKILKFKSMTDEKDENGKLLPDAKRLTFIGKIIRSTSIDELPQLINVLKGDMSFVGPRPLGAPNLPYYNEDEMHRHDVRPGITGLAQVNGRKSISWEQKLAYDLAYVNKLSFILDIKILWMTFYKVIKRENVGIDSSGVKTFEAYREAQWTAEGRQDLIDEARKKSKLYWNMINKTHS